jgi:hypothetical protein
MSKPIAGRSRPFRISKLKSDLEKIIMLAEEALDAGDPLIFEKDWFSDDPAESIKVVFRCLTKIRSWAKYGRETP